MKNFYQTNYVCTYFVCHNKEIGHGNETWPVTEMDMKRLNTRERKISRRIYGPIVEQGIRRIRTDQEFRELYKDLDLAADIKKTRLSWLGHLIRKDHGRIVKKIFESKPEGRSNMGRPRLRWLEDVEKDLREMKVKDGNRRQ